MKPTLSLAVVSFFVLSFCQTRALTLEELHALPGLTPQTFARHFSNFKFTFRADVQRPSDFLASQAGDCDDFSTLAASELSARGYTPRLIAVRMKKEVHVICYVTEANGYLDYNLRSKGGFVPCSGQISEIATSVAKSFKNAEWTSASEFTFSDNTKRLVSTALPKDRLTASAPRTVTRN
jgi:hypothetical protein